MSEITQSSRFHYTNRYRTLSIVGPILPGFLCACSGLWALTALVPSTAPTPRLLVFDTLARLFVLIPFLGTLAWTIWAIRSSLQYRRTYLSVSVQGLEYQAWPKPPVRCEWDQVEGIHRSRGAGVADILTFHPTPAIPASAAATSGKQAARDDLQAVLLNRFEGWPSGALADALRRHCPRLLDGLN